MPETIKDLWDLLHEITTGGEPAQRLSKCAHGCKAYIEAVHSSPQMGVKSAFTFGQGLGRLEMALTAANVPFERVRPQEWQKAMKCMSGGNKNVTKSRAQELFPSLKITHANADALLIATYGKSKNSI